MMCLPERFFGQQPRILLSKPLRDIILLDRCMMVLFFIDETDGEGISCLFFISSDQASSFYWVDFCDHPGCLCSKELIMLTVSIFVIWENFLFSKLFVEGVGLTAQYAA